MSLADEIRKQAERHLRDIGALVTPETIEGMGRWMLSIWYASNLLENGGVKDVANIFIHGCKPIGSIDEETRECTDHDMEDDCLAFLNRMEVTANAVQGVDPRKGDTKP